MAAGLARMGLIVQTMAETVPLVGATSEAGQALLDAIKKLSRHVQPGQVGDAEKRNQLQQMMMQQQQQGSQLAALRAAGGGGGQPQAGARPAA